MNNVFFAKRKDSRYIYACLAGVIVILMYLALLIVCRITPFGDNTWVMYDLKRQYIDFYSYYRQVCMGEENVLYSFKTALGSGMIGFFVYYLNNPLFLIFNLFAEEDLPNAITLVIGLTLVIGAVIMALFLTWYTDGKNRNRQITEEAGGSGDDPVISPTGILMGSVAWAFSGFLIAHGMNMMWTDVVIMLPVIIYATEGMIRADKPGIRERVIYVISLSVILLFNYYISYQVLLYVAIWTLISLWVSKEEHPVRKIADLALCTVIPVLIDSVVLLPTLLELADSPKDITKLGMEATGRMLSPVDVFSKIFILAYDEIQPRFGLPQVYAGVIMLIPAIMFFLNGKRSVRERIGRLLLLSVLLLSFCIDQFNLFWHAMMEPSGHPYRQAPLFVFTLLLCAVDSISEIGMCGSVRPDEREDEQTGRKRFTVNCLCTFLILELILVIVTVKGYEYTGRKMFAANQVLIFIGVMGFYISGIVKKRPLSKVIMILMPALLAFELLANAAFTYPFISMNGEKMSSYRIKVRETKETVDRIKTSDRGFYRMENLTPRQQNDGMMYGYNGVTHYSSAGMTYVRYLLQKLGYNDDALYTHYGHDNTVTMDMLLGIRYVITEDDLYVHHGYDLMEDLSGEKEHVFKNPYALPPAICVANYDLDGIMDIGDPRKIPGDPFSVQEDMVSRLTGHKAEIFKPLKQEVSTTDTSMDAVLMTREAGEVYMYLDGIMDKIQGLAVYKDDEFLTGYGNLGCYKILNLGYHDAGEKICIRVEADSEEADFGVPVFVTEDMDAVKEAYDEISPKCPDVELVGPSSIVIRGIHDNADIYTSIPYEKGWSTDGVRVYGAFMYIPYEEAAVSLSDNGELILRFVPAGMRAGAVISSVAMIFCLIYIAVMYKKAESAGKMQDRKERRKD